MIIIVIILMANTTNTAGTTTPGTATNRYVPCGGRVCQPSSRSALAVSRNGTELVGLREARTTGFLAGEMGTDT